MGSRRAVIWSSSPPALQSRTTASRPEQTEEERRPDGTYRHPLFISHTSSPLVVSKNEDVTRGKTEFETVIYSVSASAKTELQTPSKARLGRRRQNDEERRPEESKLSQKLMTRNAGPRMTKNGGGTQARRNISPPSLYITHLISTSCVEKRGCDPGEDRV